MFDATDLLSALGDVGVTSPAAGDRGDKQVKAALECEISGRPRPSRRFRLPFSGRSIALIPAMLIMAGATTAVAGTVALFHADPTALFANTPETSPAGPGLPLETAIPSTVRMIDTFQVPDLGAVQYWVADTAEHALCQALRLPDGNWVGYQENRPVVGSTCYPTRQQVVDALIAAQGGKLRVGLLPMSVDERSASIKDSTGRGWDVYYGVVSADGAAGVKDPVNGQTAPLIDGRYFVMVGQRPGNCVGCDNLRAIDKNGHILPANYGPQQDRNH
jgi:hypothetical protein